MNELSNPRSYLPGYCVRTVTRPAKEKPLTKTELKLVKALQTVRKESILGHCIHNTLDRARPGDVRKLVQELNEQLRDAYENTSAFLGTDITELLSQLKP